MFELILKQIKTGYNLAVMNLNFTRIKEVLEQRVLHRKDGHNVMEQDLDMNGYSILNADIEYGPFEERLGTLSDRVEEVNDDLQITKNNVSNSFSTIGNTLTQVVNKNLEQDGRITALEEGDEDSEATTDSFGSVKLARPYDVSYEEYPLPEEDEDRVVTAGLFNLNKVTHVVVPSPALEENTYGFLIPRSAEYCRVDVTQNGTYVMEYDALYKGFNNTAFIVFNLSPGVTNATLEIWGGVLTPDNVRSFDLTESTVMFLTRFETLAFVNVVQGWQS